jgi:hypothetical protein
MSSQKPHHYLHCVSLLDKGKRNSTFVKVSFIIALGKSKKTMEDMSSTSMSHVVTPLSIAVDSSDTVSNVILPCNTLEHETTSLSDPFHVSNISRSSSIWKISPSSITSFMFSGFPKIKLGSVSKRFSKKIS